MPATPRRNINNAWRIPGASCYGSSVLLNSSPAGSAAYLLRWQMASSRAL